MSSLLPFIFWAACAFVAVLSLLPGEYLPVAFDWWDKAQHALAFLVLGLLAFGSYPTSTRRLLIGLLFYGAAIEFAQAITGWRYGDWQDWVADGVGLCIAYSGWRIGKRY